MFYQKEVHSVVLSNAQNAYTIIFAILNYMDSFLISAVIIPLVGSGMVLGGLLRDQTKDIHSTEFRNFIDSFFFWLQSIRHVLSNIMGRC